MLTFAELRRLERSLRPARVLSVYIDGTATDPAMLRTWRVALDGWLSDLRLRIGGTEPEEREQFSTCVLLLESQLKALTLSIGAPGWVAYITPTGVRYAERVAIPFPTRVAWRLGANVAPYLRALKESRPVIVALMDSRKSVLFRYRLGRLDEVETLRAHMVERRSTPRGDAPRPTLNAEGGELEGMNRMLSDLVDRASAHAGAEGWILLGGTPRIVSHAMGMLGSITPRVRTAESLDVHASPDEIAAAAREGASALREAWVLGQIDEIAASAEDHSLGVIGAESTARALDLACVRELYISPTFLEERGAEADLALQKAFDQEATVEEVSRDAARRLDELGGIAARLRYRPDEMGVEREAGERVTSAT